MLTVLLVDDHALVRMAIKQLLTADRSIQVIGAVESGQQALQFVRAVVPDIVLLDLVMPGMSGLEITQRLLRIAPHLKIIILTSHEGLLFIPLLRKVGAVGYLTKNVEPKEMLKAIHTIANGGSYLYYPLAQQLINQPLDEKIAQFNQLSSREIEILWMICRGMPVDDIAKELFLSKKTVHTYRYGLFKKLAVKSNVELTKLAIRAGLIEG